MGGEFDVIEIVLPADDLVEAVVVVEDVGIRTETTIEVVVASAAFQGIETAAAHKPVGVWPLWVTRRRSQLEQNTAGLHR